MADDSEVDLKLELHRAREHEQLLRAELDALHAKIDDHLALEHHRHSGEDFEELEEGGDIEVPA